MTLVAMGLGTRKAPAGANLDPTESFWSFLSMVPELSGKGESGVISGLVLRPSTKKTMTIEIGGDPAITDAGAIKMGRRMILVSNIGDPETVSLPASDGYSAFEVAVALYVDISKKQPDQETAGTPQYVKTLVVKNETGASRSFADEKEAREQIEKNLPTEAQNAYLYLGWIKVPAYASSISNDDCHPAGTALPTTGKIIQTTQQKIEQLEATTDKKLAEITKKINTTLASMDDVGKTVSLVSNTDGVLTTFAVNNSPAEKCDHYFSICYDSNVSGSYRDLITVSDDGNSFKVRSSGYYLISIFCDILDERRVSSFTPKLYVTSTDKYDHAPLSVPNNYLTIVPGNALIRAAQNTFVARLESECTYYIGAWITAIESIIVKTYFTASITKLK